METDKRRRLYYFLIEFLVFIFAFGFSLLFFSVLYKKVTFLLGVIVIPVAFTLILAYSLYRSLRKNNTHFKNIKGPLLYILAGFYIIIESILTMITLHTYFSLLLLIPFTLTVFSFLLFDKIGVIKSPVSPDGEPDSRLTDTVRKITGNYNTEVYVTDQHIRRYVIVSENKPERIYVEQNSLVELSDKELESEIIFTYYSRTENQNRRILRFLLLYVVISIWIMGVFFVISMNEKVGISDLIFSVIGFLGVLMLISSPLVWMKIINEFNIKLYTLVIGKTHNYDALKSLLLKEAENINMPVIVDEYRYTRIRDARIKNANKIIKKLDKYQEY